MAKKVEKKTEGKALTRAQKTEATRQIVREVLANKPTKHNELMDEVAGVYVLRHGEEGENPNDVKGRIGSVLDIMKKNSEVMYDGGMYALKARIMLPPPVEEPVKKTRGRAKKAEEKAEVTPAPAEKAEVAPAPAEKVEEKPAKRTRAKKAKVEMEKTEEKAEPAPKAEPVAEEKPAPKKRGRKPKAAAVPVKEEKTTEEKPIVPAPVELPKAEEPKAEESKKEEPKVEEPKAEAPKAEVALIEKPKAEVAKKNMVMDMSFLFGEPKTPKKAPEKREEKKEERKPVERVKAEPVKPVEKVKAEPVKSLPKTESVKAEEKPAQRAEEKKPAQRTERRVASSKGKETALTPDEKLKESFLKKMRALGGDYFEYYSIYLLERYSIQNGRRLEGLRISGGDHDGGIDGELELTDALGFKETIYIQSKNWDPDKGKEDKWVVGETLLQQFIGACAHRQAKEGKIHARGIFITTSRFTPEAKRILEDMGDKIVGYDGSDLYEAAKECGFGLIKKNGEWSLDEKLLSGPKAFFQMWL